jgi:translation initiation factor 5
MATVNIRRDVEDKFYVSVPSFESLLADCYSATSMPVLAGSIKPFADHIECRYSKPKSRVVATASKPSFRTWRMLPALLIGRPHVSISHSNFPCLDVSTDPTKFFGCELGAQTTFANDRYIVNGAHQSDRLRELLDVFIEKFVLCPSCKNPETELVITGRGQGDDIHRDCKACGRQNGIDMRHKLTTFILKNPPKKKGKKGKKGMTADANVGGSGPGIVVEDEAKGSDGDDDDLVAATMASVDDLDKIIGRQEVIPDISPVTAKIADDDWSVDTSDAAVAARMKSLEVNVDAIVNGGEDDADEEDADSPYSLLGLWLEANRSASDADIVAKMKDLAISGKHKALVEIGEKLFTDKVVAEVGARQQLLASVSSGAVAHSG